MAEPTAGQLALLLVAILLFAAAAASSVARLRWDREPLRLAARACLAAGTLVGLGVVVWHAASRGRWQPLEDNFDTLVWLGLLLALFVLYVQYARPLRGLDAFVIPIVVLLLISAAVFGRTKPHEYDVQSVWLWVHRVTAYGGTLGFAVAAAGGAMYLLVNRRLRTKGATTVPHLGSLERLEHLTLVSVTLGFSLLTIGTITGLARMLNHHDAQTSAAKIGLTAAAWLVYAVVLHSPINPSFRGRRAALLSVFGFVVMVGVIVAVQFA